MITTFIWGLRVVWSPRQHKTSNITAFVLEMQCFPDPQNLLDEVCWVSAQAPSAVSTLATLPLPAALTYSLGELPMSARHFLLPPSLRDTSHPSMWMIPPALYSTQPMAVLPIHSEYVFHSIGFHKERARQLGQRGEPRVHLGINKSRDYEENGIIC